MIGRRDFNKGFLAATGVAIIASAIPAEADMAQAKPQVCMVIEDVRNGAGVFREGISSTRYSPCSSFKIAIALMGFDSGILQDPHHPLLDYKPGYYAPMEQMKEATDPTIWLRDSVVWYSQQTTRKLGMERFQAYVNKFDYGNRDLSGNPGKNDGLTQAWLMSSLAISPDEQVGFIRRLLTRTLTISNHAYDMTIASMPVFSTAGGWTIRGKTGSGVWQDSGAYAGKQQGWFVGWAENDKRQLAFARFEITARDGKPGGIKARDALLAGFDKMVG
ncbi:MAG TPA: class D beta-lactamase [Dongiaceae bacterium]|jgi:beta-lactamase class D